MKVRWSPHLRPKTLPDNSVLLLSETETFALSGAEYKNVIDSIETGQSIYSLNHLGFYENACVLRAVDQLIQQNLVVPEQGDVQDQVEQHHGYYYPDFEKSFASQQSRTGKIKLIVLTECDNFNWRATWLTEIDINHALTVVIVDDYLDPRLAQINILHQQEKRPWLLLKVTGEKILAGPLFHPDIDQAPCWQCLSERMNRNQPARMWLSRLGQHSPCVLPVKIDNKIIKRSLSMLQRPVTTLIAEGETGKLIHLDLATTQFTSHTVSKRPQCACCGQPELIRKQIEAPIVLQANKGPRSFDGGYRTEHPQSTLNRLNVHISPLTGAIASLRELNMASLPDKTPSSSIQIYQSTFFKSPHRIHSISVDPFVQVCLGKGIDAVQSRASALCEAFERYAAQYQGDESHIYAIPADLEYPAILPQQLAPFSDAQYQAFTQLPRDELEAHHGVKPYNEKTTIPWSRAWSLTHQQSRYLPTTYCFANTPFDETHYCRWGSNGCAAGNSLEEAILQGLFELIERDAVSIWWYNKIIRPQVDLAILPAAHRERLSSTLEDEWHYWVLDITHDLGIPVMVAVGQHKQTGKFSLGFGCHVDQGIAIERALTELCQLIPIRDQSHQRFNFDDIQAEPFLFPAPTSPVNSGTLLHAPSTQDINAALDDCIKQIEDRGLEFIVLNYSRPDIPLFTVNVVVPGLCHIWPQMGCERLYEVPVKMGWLQQPLNTFEMNALPLFI